MKRRTMQGGSIASFISFGVIIALVFVGSFYYLKVHGDQVRKDQTIAQTEKEKAAKQSTQTQTQNKAASSGGTKTDSSNQTSGNTKTGGSSDNTNTGTVNVIPTTGPEMVLGEMLGMGALAVAITGFATSRRHRARYL